jgi:hypothetical protein
LRNLTVECSANEFLMDCNRLPSQLERMARDYADRHHQLYMKYRSQQVTWGRVQFHIPDFEALICSMTQPLTMLYRIVRNIVDSEDVVESLDPDEDLEELAHAQGELYASKTLYLSLRDGIEAMEEDRLIATWQGLEAKDYFYKVEEFSGIVGEENMKTNNPRGRRIGSSGSNGNSVWAMPLYTPPAPLQSAISTNSFVIPRMAPAVSATPPKIPALPF